MSKMVYKVMSVAQWQDMARAGLFDGSADDRRDGFIHLSTSEQLKGTLQKHFSGRTDLVLLAVDTAGLGSDLRWEASRGGQLFPHLYKNLAASSVVWVEPIEIDGAGEHLIPSAVAESNEAGSCSTV